MNLYLLAKWASCASKFLEVRDLSLFIFIATSRVIVITLNFSCAPVTSKFDSTRSYTLDRGILSVDNAVMLGLTLFFFTLCIVKLP